MHIFMRSERSLCISFALWNAFSVYVIFLNSHIFHPMFYVRVWLAICGDRGARIRMHIHHFRLTPQRLSFGTLWIIASIERHTKYKYAFALCNKVCCTLVRNRFEPTENHVPRSGQTRFYFECNRMSWNCCQVACARAAVKLSSMYSKKWAHIKHTEEQYISLSLLHSLSLCVCLFARTYFFCIVIEKLHGVDERERAAMILQHQQQQQPEK